MSPPATTISRSRGSRSCVSVIWSPWSIAQHELVGAVGDLQQPRDPPRLAELGLVVVGLVLEEERDDSLRDQVPPVDPREALGDHRPHAELRGSQRRVLAARPLAVVVPGDDEPSAPLLRPARELRIAVLERELGDCRHVRPIGHDGRAVRREVAGRDVVRRHDQDAQLERVRKLLRLGRRLDVRAARDLDRASLVGGSRREDVRLDDGGPGRRSLRQLRRVELAWVGDLALQHRDGCDRGRAEVDVVVRRAAPPGEVPVEGSERVGARGRRLPHPDAGPARGLQHADARREQLDVGPRLRDLVEDLPRAGSRRRGHELLGDLVPAERRAHDRHVLVGRVDRRADADLCELRPDELLHRHDVPGAGRLRHERNERSEVDVLGLVEVILRVARLERDELATPVLLVEPGPSLVVGRETRRRSRRARRSCSRSSRAPCSSASSLPGR